MAYLVKQLAEMSGVSARTLRFYDQAGLLKPAFHGANGYRFYEEAQLLRLQQILFYRKLGLELREIKKILRRPDFDAIGALESHRKVLRRNLSETKKLITTIDKTIAHLKGKRTMKTEEIFAGFDAKTQAKHEEYLVNRFGGGMREGIEQSKKRVKNWTKADWEKSSAAFNAICADLTKLLAAGASESDPRAQAVVRRHFEWLKQFWTPNRESYAGHADLMVSSDLRKPYEAHDPRLPEFIAAAIKTFAERELE